ncbi:DUF4253 domain-containing protein [Clostridium sp. MCC353]|uniref:DUF4253 domain-containing protein n=1 Tax=Clostridium sp. MCC353 TaxID=2592646 RepID=UPI001C030219|nr:DUF4253 domain-containing protein [Clostridium sp. MCC353]
MMVFMIMLPFFTVSGQMSGGEVLTQKGEYLGLEYIDAGTDAFYIQTLYLEKLKEWEGEGYVPFIVQEDDFEVMEETIARVKEDYGSIENYTKDVLEKSKKTDAEHFFEENQEAYLWWQEYVNEGNSESASSWEKGPLPQYDLYLPSYAKRYLILKVPAKMPYEVLAYVPFGGYNACPLPEEHIAVAKRWYEQYGAVPCAVGYDTLQFYLETPVTDKEDVEQLAKEMMIYCEDIVTQGAEDIEYLERSIRESPFWFFWWD